MFTLLLEIALMTAYSQCGNFLGKAFTKKVKAFLLLKFKYTKNTLF